jgi:hypothetical protein
MAAHTEVAASGVPLPGGGEASSVPEAISNNAGSESSESGASPVVPAPMGSISAPPKLLTITVINSNGGAISTQHVRAADSPSIVSGDVKLGTSKN